MKHIVPVFLVASALAVSAAPSAWVSDFEAAKAKAVAEKKNLLVNFTGSDWCEFCIRLDKEVFRKEAFLNGVKDKFVLVTIDFPEDEAKLDEKTRTQNAGLQEKYRVEGYPTILLADAAGRPFGFTGFQEGGAENYVAHLEEFLERKAALDKAVEESAKLEGQEKAGRLATGLDGLDLPYMFLTSFYQSEIRQIESIDKNGALPFSAKLAVQRRFHELEAKVEGLIEEGKTEEALALVDAGIADASYNANQRQRMSFFKAVVYMETGKFDEALREIEVCRKFSPASEVAQGLDVLIHHIEALRQEEVEAAAAAPGQDAEAAKTSEEKPAEAAESTEDKGVQE